MARSKKQAGFVRWYNPERGFGYVRIGDGPDQALLKADVLNKGGFVYAPDGATVSVMIGDGPHGKIVTAISAVDPRDPLPSPPPPEGAQLLRATVRQFQARKGIGTLSLDEGDEVVGVETPVLRRCGFLSLRKGLAVEVALAEPQNGDRRTVLWMRPL